MKKELLIGFALMCVVTVGAQTSVPDGTKPVAKATTKKSVAVQSKGSAVEVANLATKSTDMPDDVLPLIPVIPEKPSASVPLILKETVSPISAKLDIEEAFAESLTNTFIRKVTVPIRNKLSAQQRSVNYKVKKENIGITYNAQISATSNKILNEVCEIEFPDQDKWRTENGVWKGGDITQRDVWRAINCLRNAGYEITAITVGANDKRQLYEVQTLIEYLGLDDKAVIGRLPEGSRKVILTLRGGGKADY